MSQELQYLRDEMNQRLAYLYEYPHKVLGHLLLLWGGTLALFNMSGKNFMGDIFSFFIVSTIFFISVVVIYLFSKREHENWNQILKLAAYNIIFYEKKPCVGDNDIFYWELMNFEIAMEKKKNSAGKLDRKFNYDKLSSEYFIFSLIAIGVNLFLLFLFIFKFPKTLVMDCPDNLMIGLCFFYIVISAFLSTGIYRNSIFNPKKWSKERIDYLKSYMDYAIESGYYTEDKIKERLGEDLWNEIRSYQP